MNATATTARITVLNGRRTLAFNGETDEQAQARYDRIAAEQAEENLFLYGAETVNGFEVETVTVEDLTTDDMVVFEGRTESWFVHVTTAPFRATYYNGRTGETTQADYVMISISGTRKNVRPGTAYRRALDPKAVRQAQWTGQASLFR